MTTNLSLQTALHHFNSKQYQQAETVCRQILSEFPEQPDALHLLGVIANAQGNLEVAATWMRRAVDRAPGRPDILQNLGWVLRQLKRYEEAIAVFRQLIALTPADAQAHGQLGTLLFTTAQLEPAVQCYRRAVELKPDYAEAWNNLGLALQRMNRTDEALQAYEKAAALRPDLAETHTNLGNALYDKERFAEASEALQRAIALRPNYMLPYNSLGSVLRKLDRLQESLAAYERCLALEPNFAAAHNNRSQVLVDLLRIPEAIAGFQRTLQMAPDFAEAHWNYALALLLCGDVREGWKEYEWRWRWNGFSDRGRALPGARWDGSDPAGKTLYLLSEQGIGDTIQMLRYVPSLAERGARVIVGCQNSLVRLARRVNGIERAQSADDPPPAFDAHLMMMSLPSVLGTTLQSIPCRIPYLHADEQEVVRWRGRMQDDGATFRVGLAWAGSPTHSDDRRRSILLAVYAPLSRVDAVTFYSLQKGAAADQAQLSPPGMKLIDHTGELEDFADTAALIANLDLVITVDTAVAHLAGAMGKPAWVLLPFRPDWRWRLERQDSPWYPTLLLYRQKSRGDWPEVIERICHDFADLRRHAPQRPQREQRPK